MLGSGTQEFCEVDKEVAMLIAALQLTCGQAAAQKKIDEIWKLRV